MNRDSLESLLREKIAVGKPRPGFETRIQAMAREPFTEEESHLARWIGGISLAAVAIVLALPRSPQTPAPTGTTPALVELPTSPAAEQPAISLTKGSVEEPVIREIEGIKSDAKRAFDFLSNAVPSLTKSQ